MYLKKSMFLGYSVADVLCLQFVLHVMLFRPEICFVFIIIIIAVLFIYLFIYYYFFEELVTVSA
jgi:hypothetical protein